MERRSRSLLCRRRLLGLGIEESGEDDGKEQSREKETMENEKLRKGLDTG